jgi:hypothetical protein
MSRRWIADTVLGLALTAVCASAARRDHSLLEGETGLAGGSVLLALIISFLMGLVCFTLMVWDPKERKSGRGRDTNE